MKKYPSNYQLAAVLKVADGRTYGSAEVIFVRRMNEDGDIWSFNASEFSGLRLSCQWDKADSEYRKRGEPYAFQVEYDNETTLENFEKRAALLRRVKQGLERAYQKNGNAETFGEWVMRVFHILDVEVLMELGAGQYVSRLGASDPFWQPNEFKTRFNALWAKTLEVKS